MFLANEKLNSTVKKDPLNISLCHAILKVDKIRIQNGFSEMVEVHSLVIRKLFTPKNSLMGRKFKVIFY